MSSMTWCILLRIDSLGIQSVADDDYRLHYRKVFKMQITLAVNPERVTEYSPGCKPWEL